MASLNIFASDAFTFTEMSLAIEKSPYKPRLLGSIPGLVADVPVRTKTIWIEERQGKLSLLPTAPRGTINAVKSQRARKGRLFEITHVPYYREILADDVLGLRAFGSETELETVASYVNDELMAMRDDHEVTHEFRRVSALKGILLDADNSTVIYNYFTEFSESQVTEDWTTTATDFSTTAIGATRKIANALGNDTFSSVIALCGDTYFDNVVKHASVKAAYDRWINGEFLRAMHIGPQWYGALASQGFVYQNVLFINYRGKIGDVTFIPLTEAYYFPADHAGLIQRGIAPADTTDAVGTKGKLIYAQQELNEFNTGVKLRTQSNTLEVLTRPSAVIKSTVTVA